MRLVQVDENLWLLPGSVRSVRRVDETCCVVTYMVGTDMLTATVRAEASAVVSEINEAMVWT